METTLWWIVAIAAVVVIFAHAYLYSEKFREKVTKRVLPGADTPVHTPGVVDLRRLQQAHAKWRAHNFPSGKEWHPLVGVSEELGEAATAFLRIVSAAGRVDHGYLKQSQGIRISEDHRAEIVDAIGDMLLYTIDFANRIDIDLADTLRITWSEVSARDWQSNKVDGS
jgi:NTP pyrophosphatase (non-canonical NTP hydrolase)